VLGSAFFACLSMTLAGLVRNRDRMMGIGQAITMPLFFASNALYPVDVMPQWLRWLSAVNPLSYEVNALRGLLIGSPTNAVLDLAVLVVAAVAGMATHYATMTQMFGFCANSSDSQIADSFVGILMQGIQGNQATQGAQ
jgi:ABC-2 type transport system permease protein